MMNIGIYDINNSSTLNYKERLDIYKECGYTSVGVYLDQNYMHNGEDYMNIIQYARDIGLNVNQVHIDYKISNLISDESTNEYFEYVESKIKEALNLHIPFIVLHASKGEDAPLISENSINKLEKMMNNYQNKNIYLCFENVRDNRNLTTILNSNINNIGMCYDLGHAYCYDNVYTLFEKHKNKILCTHLHNNYKKDSHNLLMDGEINCKKIIKKINKIQHIDNCLEVFPPKGSNLSKDEFIDFIKKSYKEYKKCTKLFF